MNKDNGFILRQNNIRLAGELFVMEPEAVAHTMQERAHQLLRPGVLALDMGHIAATLFRADFIHRDSICRQAPSCQDACHNH